MSIHFKSTLKDQFRSMRLESGEEDALLQNLDGSSGIISCDEQIRSAGKSTASKLTKLVKAAFIDEDDEETQPLMSFDEPEVPLTSREIVDVTIRKIDGSSIAGTSIKDLELLKQRYPNITEAVFSQINREDKELFDVRSWLYLKKLALKSFDLTTKELKILSASKSITHLNLAYSQKKFNSTEWSYIASLENLESLSLIKCSIKERYICEVLKKCKKIRHLKLVDCPGVSSDIVKTINSFSQLTSLQLQLLDESKPGMLESLERLSNLEDLKLSGSWLNTQSLGRLTNLKSLFLHTVNITEGQLAEVIPKLPRLEKLTLTRIGMDTSKVITFIGEHLKKLKYLDLSHCTNLDNLSPLASLEGLTYLNLSACIKINDLSVLKSLCKLEYLNLKSLDVADYSPIGSLNNLKYLNLSFCDIEDVSFLSKLEQLECLDVIQSFHKKPLKIEFVPIHLDNFKQLIISQDDKILVLRELDERLQKKIQREFIPSCLRDYI